jgi:probable F420-dependent oxidoreductase
MSSTLFYEQLARERGMATNAQVGLLVPGSFAGAPPTLSEFTAFFQRAEALGLHSLWVIDRLFHTVNILDPITLLTCAAAVTSRIRLGTAVLLCAFRNPVLMAKTTATLDYLSGGRLMLGVSLGGLANEFESLGVSMQQRVSRLRENLTVMRQLWTEPQVTFHGRYYHMDNVSMEPKPVQKPGIPILMGGRAEAVLKRSAEEADGWICGVAPGLDTPEAFRAAWQKVCRYAQAAGKDPEALEAGKLLYISVGEDRERCREQLRDFIHTYYGPQFAVDTNCAFGPPAVCAATIQRFLDAGVKTIMLGPARPDVEQVTRIANEVVPRLQ